MVSFLEDMIYVNKEVLNKTLKNFTKNWMIIFTSIVYTLISIVVNNVMGILFMGPLSIFSGIIIALIKSSIVSSYLYLLYNIVNYNRMTIDIFKEGFTYYVRNIYGILFVGYLGSLLLSIINPILGQMGSVLNLLILIMLPIALNVLPETVYLKGYDAWESIVYALEFLKENFVIWAIPNIILYAAIYLITGQRLLNVFNTHLVFDFYRDPMGIVFYSIGQIIFSFMMIYRGHLYRILSTSTRRKRMFMKKI